jgi:thiol-disulfide isomerase/thioredoxin
MKSKTGIIIIVLVLAIVGSFIAIQLTGSDEQTPSNGSVTETNPTSQPLSDNQTSSRHGKYVDYRPDAIAQAEGTKLLFFHAPWCPQCRAIEADIKKDGVPDGVTIIKVDYDTNQDLRQKYAVTIQTTFVKVDDNGNLIKTYTAYNEPTLDSVIANLL